MSKSEDAAIEDVFEEFKSFTNVEKLMQDYLLLLESGDFADVTLRVGGEQFRAHKNILSARSAVFGAMFKHEDTKEAQGGVVEINDMSAEVCQQLLRFIYSGNVDLKLSYAPELFECADKYQLEEIKTICEKYLCQHLAAESVIQVLLLADMHQATELRSTCINFITNQKNKVNQTQGWKVLLTRTDLMEEILLYAMSKI